MDVIYEHTDRSDVDVAEVEQAVDAIERIAPDPSSARLVITGDFVASNRARLTGPAAEQYDPYRTFGIAAARTLRLDDGTTDILVVAPLLHSETAADVGLHRLVCHETYHVAIHQRGEDLSGIRSRYGVDGWTHRGYYSEVAGMIADEYRVEKALCEEGMWPHHGYRSTLAETLEAFRLQLLDACILPHPNEDISRTSESVLTVFAHIATLGAYLAAESVVSSGRLAPDVTLPLWRRFVGPAWQSFVDALSVMPSAAAAVELADLDQYTFSLIGPLDDWLRQVGFEIRDEAAGLYFDVLRLPHE